VSSPTRIASARRILPPWWRIGHTHIALGTTLGLVYCSAVGGSLHPRLIAYRTCASRTSTKRREYRDEPPGPPVRRAVRALFRAPSSRQAAELPLAAVAIEARQSAVYKLDHPQR
jgi:hypothetical protein